MRTIDHLVYAVPDLEKAMDNFENLTGIRPVFGGYHTTRGTKNAVVNLGNKCYLEILAIDETNKNSSVPRWMGVDFIKEAQMTRWALKSEDLEKDSTILKKYNTNFGEMSGGERKTAEDKLLKWKMILPLAAPAIDLAPFMCDWKESEAHPTDGLPQQCELMNLHFTHSSPNLALQLFSELGIHSNVLKGKSAKIFAEINTPKGIIKL